MMLIWAALWMVSDPIPPSIPVATAKAVVPASPVAEPTKPTCTPPASAVARLTRLIAPVSKLMIVSSPAPALMPVAAARDVHSALESPFPTRTTPVEEESVYAIEEAEIEPEFSILSDSVPRLYRW